MEEGIVDGYGKTNDDILCNISRDNCHVMKCQRAASNTTDTIWIHVSSMFRYAMFVVSR